MGDYDGAAARVKGEVPDDLENQTQIREWIDNNVDWGHEEGADTDTLNREVSERIAGSREGVDTGSGTRFYDPDTGAWRDESGGFASPPDRDT